MEILHFGDQHAGGFSEVLSLDSRAVESLNSGEKAKGESVSIAPHSLEQSLLAFGEALNDCDLELFVSAWRSADVFARLQFEKEEGEQRMREAFGISYLRTLLSC